MWLKIDPSIRSKRLPCRASAKVGFSKPRAGLALTGSAYRPLARRLECLVPRLAIQDYLRQEQLLGSVLGNS